MLTFGDVTIIAIASGFVSTATTVGVAFIAPLFLHRTKLPEFRQAWINEQRKDVAEHLGLAREWVQARSPPQALAADRYPLRLMRPHLH